MGQDKERAYIENIHFVNLYKTQRRDDDFARWVKELDAELAKRGLSIVDLDTVVIMNVHENGLLAPDYAQMVADTPRATKGG